MSHRVKRLKSDQLGCSASLSSHWRQQQAGEQAKPVDSAVPALRSRLRRLSGQAARLISSEGSALTEFALVTPIFVILLIWSQFFVDLGVVRLKADEAVRYALWETTAQRQPSQIQAEVNSRFADLASPKDLNHGRPAGVRSFPNAIFTAQIQDNVAARIDARVTLPSIPGGGILNFIMGAAQNLINRAVSSIVSRFGLNQAGAATADVRVDVRNTLFPSGQVLRMFFDSGTANPNISIRTNAPTLVVDTWKAWPGKYRTGSGSSRDVNTDVYQTYPNTNANQASAVEREVAAVVSRGAFWGQGNGIIGGITNVLSYVAGNNITSSRTWAESNWRNSGPIAILPGEEPRHSFAPGYGTATQRIGGHRQTGHTNRGWVRGNQVVYPQRTVDGRIGAVTVDRSRFTIPYRVNSQNWNGLGGATNSGGTSLAPIPGINAPNRNPYVKAMDCRDVYYMGSREAQITSYDENYNLRAYRQCM